MRKLGIIGGLSWIATRTYYEQINRGVQKRFGPTSSAPLLIESLEYSQLYALKDEAGWDRAAAILVESAQRLEQAGAGALIIAANSMHRVYDRVSEAVNVPILHIADAVGDDLVRAGQTDGVVLLGTHAVMTEGFFRQRIVAKGIDLLAPDPDDAEMVDSIIYKELMLGKVTRGAERALKTIITRKEQHGAKSVVLACAELDQVVTTNANVMPVFDTTASHCRAAVDWICEDAA